MANSINNSLNVFFRSNYGRLLNFLRLMAIINLILVVVFIYLFTHVPEPKTFSSYEGKNSSLYALSEPIVSQKALLEWANQAAISVYNLDYNNYKENMKAAKSYFTPTGWSLFQNNFKTVLDPVLSQKLRVSAVSTDAPVIIQEGPLLGHYTWKIRMPLLIRYESASETKYQRVSVDMVVIRVPPTTSTKGIAITQFLSV